MNIVRFEKDTEHLRNMADGKFVIVLPRQRKLWIAIKKCNVRYVRTSSQSDKWQKVKDWPWGKTEAPMIVVSIDLNPRIQLQQEQHSQTEMAMFEMLISD